MVDGRKNKGNGRLFMKGAEVMTGRFSFEDLEVWQDAVAYADAVLEVMISRERAETFPLA
jgi:hypothetical protein